MNNLAYKYISTISFSDLYNWSFQYAQKCENLFTNKYKCVSIGSFLVRIKDPVDIEDNQNYKRVSIKLYNGGITLRDIELGVNIGTKKQFRIKQGHFLLSKIDARNGAIGIVPESCNDAIITGNFWDFEIDTNKADPQFLSLLMTTGYFVKLFDKASNGTTNRHYLQEDLFLKTEIPLPSLDIQKEFVKKYNDKIKLAKNQEKELIHLETDADNYIAQQLGIVCKNNVIKSNKYNYLTFYNLIDLSRWDLYKNDCGSIISEKYKFSKLLDVVTEKPLYGAGEKGIKKRSDIRYIRITDINEDGTLNDDFVSAEKVDPKYLLEENDFLIARSGNTVGKTFLYKKELGKCIYAGYLIKFKLDTKKIIPEYLLYYTKSNIYKQWIASNQRANAQPNINSNEFLNSPIIIPPLEEQNYIVNHLQKIKEKIINLKQQAEQNRIAAQEEFEKELFE
ncbi:type I restriction modification DNA specificity domain protein [Clostridium sp. CAG:813]|nr:type I restriction modification DNA specificity domain protein [Clostridium sp. CAG:813]